LSCSRAEAGKGRASRELSLAEAAGEVNQQTVERRADAATDRSERDNPVCFSERADDNLVRLPGAVKVELATEHEPADLIIAADLAADDRTGQ
jgi:hypothetical protein